MRSKWKFFLDPSCDISSQNFLITLWCYEILPCNLILLLRHFLNSFESVASESFNHSRSNFFKGTSDIHFTMNENFKERASMCIPRGHSSWISKRTLFCLLLTPILWCIIGRLSDNYFILSISRPLRGLFSKLNWHPSCDI